MCVLVVGLRLPVVQSEACSKCGYFKKSGKRSCCAVGGAWFKDCGDANNPNVNHTWVEGVEACSDFAGESSGEAAMQGMLRHETTMGGMLRAAGQWNVSRQQATTTSISVGTFDISASAPDTAYSTTLQQQLTTRATSGVNFNVNISQGNVTRMISHSRTTTRTNVAITQGDSSSALSSQQGTGSINDGAFNAADADSIARVKLEHVVVFSCLVFVL